MPRPSEFSVLETAVTSSGVQFTWLLDGYKARGAPDANTEIVHAMVAWDKASDFLRDIVGYTTWDGTSPNLNRVLPQRCPTRKGLWADEHELADFGMYETREDCADPDLGIPEQDWCIYAITFIRPKWFFLTDDQLKAPTYDNEEQFRYCRRSRRYSPRERRQSGFAYEYQLADGTFKDVPDEARFTPDYDLEYLIEWRQVPISAIPESSIADLLLTVNKDPIDLGVGYNFATGTGITFEPGSILFKGPQQGMEMYQGADGNFYENLPYVFAYRPGGWNTYLRPDLKAGKRDYGPIRRKGTLDPLYPLGDHQKLFIPADPNGE